LAAQPVMNGGKPCGKIALNAAGRMTTPNVGQFAPICP
jgi:hypothetical protein